MPSSLPFRSPTSQVKANDRSRETLCDLAELTIGYVYNCTRCIIKRVRHPTATKANVTLPRLLGTGSAAALVISNMIGATIFGTTGLMLGALGKPSYIISAWSIGAVFALAGALSYAELGINFPSSGGEYVYLTRAYGNEWGFMSGWVSFFAGFSAPIATSALIFAYYCKSIFPQLGGISVTLGTAAFPLQVGCEQIVATILIAASTGLNCLGIQRTSKVQNILTVSKVLMIILLVVCGFLLGTGRWEYFGQAVARTSTRPLPVEFSVQLLWVMVGYSGWNAATYVAEELRQPVRTLPKALALGTLVVAVLYIGLNLVFIYSTPPNDLRNVIAVGQVAARNLFGDRIGVIFSAAMAVCLMATVNAMVTIGPRVYYAMASNGLFPKAASRLHPKWRTPTVAILSQGLCAILMTATPIPRLFAFIGFSLTIFTVLAVGSVFVFRRNPDWHRLPVLDWLYPLIPASYIVVGVAMIAWGLLFQPGVSIAAIGTIFSGSLAYRFIRRSKR